MNFAVKNLSILFLLVVTGCAHQINLTPPLNTLDSDNLASIAKSVGYYISEQDRAKEVETPGGGGDKVKYKPYSDLEPALKHALANIFSDVHSVPSLDNRDYIQSNNITYIFVPTIKTDSSSDSILTWPPTDFSISLQCRALNEAGSTVWETSVEGKGHAEFEQFKHDFSLSARKAAKEALLKLEQEISKAEVFK